MPPVTVASDRSGALTPHTTEAAGTSHGKPSAWLGALRVVGVALGCAGVPGVAVFAPLGGALAVALTCPGLTTREPLGWRALGPAAGALAFLVPAAPVFTRL